MQEERDPLHNLPKTPEWADNENFVSDNEHRPFTLFAVQLQKIPCFKYTHLYGIGSGIAASLAYYLATSQFKARTFCMTYAIVGTGYFLSCRYKNAQGKLSDQNGMNFYIRNTPTQALP